MGLAQDDNDDEEQDDNNKESLEDEFEGMSDEEVAELKASLVPITTMLTKVHFLFFTHQCCLINPSQLCALSNTIKNSSTIILPIWLEKVNEFGVNVCMMPRDMTTWWNSTFDMLNFALSYHAAINAITSN